MPELLIWAYVVHASEMGAKSISLDKSEVCRMLGLYNDRDGDGKFDKKRLNGWLKALNLIFADVITISQRRITERRKRPIVDDVSLALLAMVCQRYYPEKAVQFTASVDNKVVLSSAECHQAKLLMSFEELDRLVKLFAERIELLERLIS